MCKELCVELYCQETRIIKMEIHIYVMTEKDGKERKIYLGISTKGKKLGFAKHP
jgi:hypothetical protein